MSQTKPLLWRHTPSSGLIWRVFSAGFPRGDARPARIIRRFDPPFRMAKIGERAGWSSVWYISLTGWEKSAQFKLKMVSDVLLLSYLDKIGLSLTGEAGQASAYLYSEARLYKGASLTLLSQSATTRSTGNISVGVKKVGHNNNVEQWVLCSFPLKITAALSLHFQHLMKTKG
jgi:hypothetical protein